jgi:Ig-like domain from next to BRCA1 gene
VKKKILFPIVLILALALGGCGITSPTAQSELIMTVVHFSVIGTLTAMVPPTTASPTASSTPSPSPTATITPTPIPSSTQVIPPAPPDITWYWPTTTANGCYDAAFVKDVNIPDGTVFAPGQEFEKTWKVKNTGSCTWTPKFYLMFIDGNAMQGSDASISQTVEITKKADISVSLAAPKREGRYRGYWQLADKNGYTFGELMYVSIVVDDFENTPTATQTPATPTLTATPNLTASPTHHKHPTPNDPPGRHTYSTPSTSFFTPTPPVLDR